MLKLSAVEFVARAIPESFLLIFGVYAFSNTEINKKRYLFSSVLILIMVFIIRALPISYGVHTILSIMVIIALSRSINKIDTIKSIKGTIITIIVQLLCEGINILMIQYIFRKDINNIFGNPKMKIIYGIPSLGIFMCIIILHYIILLKREESQYV